jgi:hypothetical protein
MKPRDRLATGGNAPQAALAAVPLKESANGTSTIPSYQVGDSFLWEDWYRSASPDQQAELLDLARRQGLLYIHQIPPHTNGTHHANGALTHADPQVLKDILAGQVAKLPSLIPPAVEVVDQDLDPLQRQAVARALATEDICLIQGPPGTGKSRVVQEILVQASQRGLRVLFLSQNAACVDGVLEQLARHDGLLPIRLTSPGEEVPAAVQPMLLGHRVGNFRSQILEKANRSRTESEERCRERQSQAEVWPTFVSLIELRCQTENRLRMLAEELARVASEVESQAQSILGESLTEFTAKKEADLAPGRKLLEELGQETQKLQLEEACLARQLHELTTQTRSGWWSLAWWKSKFAGETEASKAEVDAKLQSTRTQLAQLTEQRQVLELQQQQIEQAFQAELQRLLQEEIARRQRSLSEQEADLQAKLLHVDEQWQTLAGQLHPEKLRPRARTAESIEESRQLWQGQKQLDEENCLIARQWVAFLQESGDRLAARLPGLAGIIAGSLAAWNHEGPAIPGSFDLLVLEEADKVPEAVLLQLARKARRWILFGNYLGPPPAASPAPANPREVRPAASRTGVFQKLWQLLHSDPSQLTYTWGQENGRLVCQFRQLSPQELGRLERESLADAADIELRILTLPRSEPVLAQVAFPPGTPLNEAKEFIFRELQETPVQTCGRNGWLDEQAESFLWRLLPHPVAGTSTAELRVPVCLGTGLTEWLHQEQTVCLEFAKSSWDRQKVADWLKRHFNHRDLGRTMFLQIPHRMEPNLAAWVGDVLFPAGLFSAAVRPEPSANGASVSFVPVIAPADSQSRGKKPTSCLEIDLAAGRGTERVPQDILAGLARHGFANYHEAQAVVRTLEKLHQTAGPGCFAVIAFHAGQVEIIRRLLARSTALTGRSIIVGLPGQFMHGQCQVAVVSLTRSNFQRSGFFATEAADAVLALTRAREQLILVGDPDTLLRWSAHQEPAESAEARREKQWVRRVARYLRSEGLHQKAFQLCESPSGG